MIDRTETNLSSSQNNRSIDLHSVRTAQPGKKWSQRITLLKIAAIATLSTLAIPSIVRADGIYMTNMKSTLTQSSINLLTDPSRTPGVQSGDIVEYVLQAKVANAPGGPGVYFTTYIPNGVEVLGAWFVTDATGATVRAPGQGGQAHNGWGPRDIQTPFGTPFSTIGNSRQSDLSGDTGIFYSTDSRTQLYTADNSNIAKGPTGNPAGTAATSNGYDVTATFYGNIDAFNLWDANQVNAFGRGGTLNSIPATNNPGGVKIVNSAGQGATPFGSGSAVAGPDTGYQLDNTGSIGPWNRIQYAGSKIADVSDGIATDIGTVNMATLLDASSRGSSFPLSSNTNAVRWSDGLRLLNEVVYVKIRVKINAPAIAVTTGTLLNFEANGSDNWNSGSKDNPWRYFGPTVPQSAQFFATKEIYKVNGVVYSGGLVPAGATITYRVRYVNLSSLPVKGVSFKDTLPTAIATTGCTVALPTLSSLSNSVTASTVTAGTPTCPAAAATVTFGNLPNVTSGVIPALRGGEFTYDVKLASTVTNGTVVTNNINFSGQDIVSSVAVSATSAISVTIGVPIDYSDAPISGTAPSGTGTNNYGTATHNVVGSLKLGANIDSETASIANATASGDGADDDGISSFPTLSPGATSYSIPAANVTAMGTGTLHAWIDFNKNGTFDVGEYTSVAVTNNTLAGDLNWSGITAGAAGNTFARFRFTSDATITAITPSGLASNGEVEDYQVSIAVAGINISGIVFEDPNYGGSAGRPFSTPTTSGRDGAIVELYSSTGTYITNTTTSGGGNYTFTGVAPGDYQVRVVNSTVTSSRPNPTSATGLVAVQTYRTNASIAGSVTPVIDRVGGEKPAEIDAPANTTATLATLNGVTNQQVQSLTTVKVASSAVSGVDFGYNFDTIVNTNDSGQGSLRQFIRNSNALSNTGLAQALPASITAPQDVSGTPVNLSAYETSIFMIPDPNNDPRVATGTGLGQINLAASAPEGGSGSAFVINLTSANLDDITDPFTSIDGRTQTVNIPTISNGSDLNVNLASDSESTGPEVVINATSNDDTAIIDTRASNTIFHSIGVTGASGVKWGIRSSQNGDNISGGTKISNFILDNLTIFRMNSCGVFLVNADNAVIRNSVIRDLGFDTGQLCDGIQVRRGSSNTLIDNNLLFNSPDTF
jgi:hypothetical protein